MADQCGTIRLQAFGCVDALGVAIGAVEDEIWWTFGAPTQLTYRGNDKIMRYDDLGLSFQLRRYQITAIDHFRRSGRFSYVPRAFRVMVPH